MADYNTIRRPATTANRAAVYDEGLRAYMNKVYGLMTVGMLVTAVVAWGFAQMAGGPGAWTEFGRVIYTTPVRWVIMLLPLVMVFAFGAAISRLSTQGATLLFYAFAAAMGASLSSIFLRYTGSSIALTFVATAAGFAGLSLYGYTTKRDLTGMGNFFGNLGETVGNVSVASFASVRLTGWALPSAGAAKMSRLVDSGSIRPASRSAK